MSRKYCAFFSLSPELLHQHLTVSQYMPEQTSLSLYPRTFGNAKVPSTCGLVPIWQHLITRLFPLVLIRSFLNDLIVLLLIMFCSIAFIPF